jgi:hypothetical protein
MSKTGRINTPALYRRNRTGISVNGKTGRITITKRMIRNLNKPDYIKIVFEDERLIISRGTERDYPVYYGRTYQSINRKHLGLYILYEYTLSYDFDATIPFRKVEWKSSEDGDYFIIDMSDLSPS